MTKVEYYKNYGDEMFRWEFQEDYDNHVYIEFKNISGLIPTGEKTLFTSSNEIEFCVHGNAYISPTLICLPEEDFNEVDYIKMPSKETHKALLEFHEFCLKNFKK